MPPLPDYRSLGSLIEAVDVIGLEKLRKVVQTSGTVAELLALSGPLSRL